MEFCPDYRDSHSIWRKRRNALQWQEILTFSLPPVMSVENDQQECEILNPYVFLFLFQISLWNDFHQNTQSWKQIFYTTWKYTVCKCVLALFSLKIWQAGAVTGLKTGGEQANKNISQHTWLDTSLTQSSETHHKAQTSSWTRCRTKSKYCSMRPLTNSTSFRKATASRRSLQARESTVSICLSIQLCTGL